jgi:hypothetical protein
MIGRSLSLANASMAGWLNNFGTVLTPMMPVGWIASTAATDLLIGRCSCPNGRWKSARSARERAISSLMSKSRLRLRDNGGEPSLNLRQN